MLCPFDLRIASIAQFLNCELVDDPVYDGLELQYFDDPIHGTGLLAFLSRRADRRVDYYPEPGLRLDPAGYVIGGGTGAWTKTVFDAAHLRVADDGVDADVRFTDVDGRPIEIVINDRRRPGRRRGDLLAPVSAGTERPDALLLVWLHGFDLVRATGPAPVIRIDGRDAPTGSLPGARLHRRRLIKYAAPLCSVELNRNDSGAVMTVDTRDPGPVELTADGRRVVAITARQGTHHARFALSPPMPGLAALPDSTPQQGTWAIDVDGARITEGTWSATRNATTVELALAVRGRWKPGPLPLLMRLATTVMPVFRRWPTTYRWTATASLDQQPTMISRWGRTTTAHGDAYRRATQHGRRNLRDQAEGRVVPAVRGR